MAKMTDMKRTKADKKAEREKYDGHKLGEDDYPYGLSVRLDHHSLKKLGLHKGALPKVGSKIMIHSHAHVKSAGESSHDDGREDRHLELELRHMHIEHGEGKKLEKSDGDTEEDMKKGMKHAIDKAVVGPKEEGDEDGEGEEA